MCCGMTEQTSGGESGVVLQARRKVIADDPQRAGRVEGPNLGTG